MDSKLLKICLAACLAVSFAGCDDVDKDAPKAGDRCTATFQAVMGAEYGIACLNNEVIVTQCGDGKVQGAEQCEGTDVGNATCEKKLGAGAVGRVTCNGCRLDYTGCALPVTPAGGRVAGNCGDGVLNIGEDCDGSNLDNQSCGSLIVGGKGSLSCSSSCKYDFSDCHVDPKEGGDEPETVATCGNGKLDDEELCDVDADGKVIVLGDVTCADALNNEKAIGELGCTDKCELDVADCSIPVPETCGNGELDDEETCDLDADGNALIREGDSCASALDDETAIGELGCTDKCQLDTSACEANLCGNGVLDEGEFCDGDQFVSDANLDVDCAEGFAQTAHPCNADCSAVDAEAACEEIPEGCGNGVLDDGEACDGELLNDLTCADIVEGSEGELKCNAVCKFDVEGCVEQKGDVPAWCLSDDDCVDATCDRGVCVTAEMLEIEVGSVCDPDAFVEFCKEDGLVYCGLSYDDEGEIARDDNGEMIYVVDLIDCADEGGCGIVNMQKYIVGAEEPVLMAWCNGAIAEDCVDDDTKITFCAEDGDGSYASYYFCAKNTEDGYTALSAANILNSWGDCKDGLDDDGNPIPGVCNEEKTQCENPVTLWCDYNYRCADDDTLSVCVDYGMYGGVVVNDYKCSEEIEGSVCATVRGEDMCLVPCTEEGEVIMLCDKTTDGDDISTVKVCTRGADDRLYYVESANYCNHGCDSETNECIKLLPEEGDACDVETYVGRCEDNMVVKCDYFFDEVYVQECAEGLSCVETEAGMPECLLPCDEVDSHVSICEQVRDSEDRPTSAYLITNVCKEVGDGLYYVESGFMACADDLCTEDMTACDDICENVGETKTRCLDEDPDAAYLMTFECVEIEEGNNRYVQSDFKACENAFCSDDYAACGMNVEPELVPCDTVDEIVKVCTTQGDEEDSIAMVNIFVCTETDDGLFLEPALGTYLCEAGCNEALDDCLEIEVEPIPCETVDEVVKVCTPADESIEGSVAMVVTSVCTETDDGLFLQTDPSAYICEAGCNEDLTDCAESEEGPIPCGEGVEEGETVQICTPNDEGGQALVTSFMCTNIGDGMYLQPLDGAFLCDAGCNEALDGCAEGEAE